MLESFAKLYPGRAAGVVMRATGTRGYSSQTSSVAGNSVYNYMDINKNLNGMWRAGIFYRLKRPSDGVRFKYGIRGEDLPEGLWAIVPYSFMVDRVVDVSGAIRAATNLADPNIQILAGYVTHSVKRDVFFASRSYSVVTGTMTETGTGDLCSNFKTEVTRKPWLPSYGDVKLPANLPDLTNSFTKVADLVALTLLGLKR